MKVPKGYRLASPEERVSFNLALNCILIRTWGKEDGAAEGGKSAERPCTNRQAEGTGGLCTYHADRMLNLKDDGYLPVDSKASAISVDDKREEERIMASTATAAKRTSEKATTKTSKASKLKVAKSSNGNGGGDEKSEAVYRLSAKAADSKKEFKGQRLVIFTCLKELKKATRSELVKAAKKTGGFKISGDAPPENRVRYHLRKLGKMGLVVKD